MSEFRLTTDLAGNCFIKGTDCKYGMFDKLDREQIIRVIDKLNSLYNDKEDWKHNAMELSNENSILWNELSIMREQGAKPSDAFENYLNSKIKRINEKQLNKAISKREYNWIMDNRVD